MVTKINLHKTLTDEKFRGNLTKLWKIITVPKVLDVSRFILIN